MNKRRLLKLADLLEADAKNKKGIKFNLKTWAGPAEERSGVHVYDAPQERVTVDCGTTACAFGLAAISGAFKRQGLTYRFKPRDWGASGYFLEPKLGRRTQMDAAMGLFGINKQQASWLFHPDYYDERHWEGSRGERAVAKRIRNFVAGKISP